MADLLEALLGVWGFVLVRVVLQGQDTVSTAGQARRQG